MDIKKIHFEGYKCFDKCTIDSLKPINVIIGKNNIGKSSILDIIEMLYDFDKLKGNNIKICLEKSLSDEEILSVFSKTTSGGGIPGPYHYEYGKKFIGTDFIFEIFASRSDIQKRPYNDLLNYNSKYDAQYKSYWDRLSSNVKYEIKIPKRVLAERNIFPEFESELMTVDGNGNGITRIINNFINKDEYDESLVRINLLNRLNEIMGDDATFTEIVTQQIKINNETKWEIFLREEKKGRVSLSSSGSGLKTILMVLVYTILIPNIEKKKLSNYIFMFEELENNLHPSLQRRLLTYIESLCGKGAIFFLTTHSNILLDNFQNNDNVNILHIQKDKNNIVSLNNTADNIQKNNVLNDLGLKASDLLQSNGIIWVEGPSDRLYINKWIELWSNGTQKEGKNYQCVFYGGRLLSNLSFDEETDLINLININRNSIIVIDSDKDSLSKKVNQTKKRIESETIKNNIMCWITKGREIENYVSKKIIKEYHNVPNKKVIFKQFDNIEDFLDKLKTGEGKRFLKNKIEFAKKILEDKTKNDFETMYDLDEKMKKVIKHIESWNKD